MNNTKNTPPRALQRTLSQARVDAISAEAVSVMTGLEALAELGGLYDGDTVAAVQVRWFTDRIRDQMFRILAFTDLAEPEPV